MKKTLLILAVIIAFCNNKSAFAATLTVSDEAQLRYAITNAAAGDTILITADITLTQNLNAITKANIKFEGAPTGVEGEVYGINAAGFTFLTYNANGAGGISGLELSNGVRTGSGGAISTTGKFTGDVVNSVFDSNSTVVTTNASVYAAAIYATGGFSGNIVNTAFTNNSITTSGVTSYGGAIYTSGIFSGDIVGCLFDNNSSTSTGTGYSHGGAIRFAANVNTDFTGTILNTIFTNNSTTTSATGTYSEGGAISAGSVFNGDIINCLFDNNSATTAGTNANGGAIWAQNTYSGDITNSVFKNNSANSTGTSASGGAISASNTFTGDITDSIFYDNSATSSGTSYAYGGAIHFLGSFIGNIEGSSFINNSATSTKLTGAANARGGAIAEAAGVKGDIKNSSFLNNTTTAKIQGAANGTSASAYGGALYVANASATESAFLGNIDKTTFENNSATATIQSTGTGTNTATAFGGAIYGNNTNTTATSSAFSGEISNSTFKNNSATATSTSAGTSGTHARGGAIHLNTGVVGGTADTNGAGVVTISNSTFEGNSATATAQNTAGVNNVTAYGGALYIGGSNSVTNFEGDVAFVGNSVAATSAMGTATAQGGAIYSNGVLNFGLETGDTFFEKNTVNSKSNDIYLASAAAKINIGKTGIESVHSITLNGGLAGVSGSMINQYSGNFNLSGDNSKFLGSINVNETGKMTIFNLENPVINASSVNIIGKDAQLNVYSGIIFNSPIVINQGTLGLYGNSILNNQVTVGSTLTSLNGEINTITINGNLILSDNSNIRFDINPQTGESDLWGANTLNTNGNALIIDDINPLTSPTGKSFSFQFLQIDDGTYPEIRVSNNVLSTPIGKYLLSDLGAGLISGNFESFNPTIFRGQVATVAQYANQLAVNNILFDHAAVVTNGLLANVNSNRYAASEIQFSPYLYSKIDGGVWMKTYGNFEKIRMSQDLTVGNNAYGVLIGGDLPMKNIGRGWHLTSTGYAAYNGAHQYFSGIGMFQNGGQLGAMATFDKGGFINSILAYGGYFNNHMSVPNSFDNMGNWFAGVANKSAYNKTIAKDLILQPTFLVSYNAFGEQNWHTDFGNLDIQSGMLNGINIAPGANLIWQKETGSIYGTVQWMFNIMGTANGNVGNIQLPNIGMGTSFIEYGVGFTKKFKDRLTMFLQTTIRNGTRTGIGVQAGVNWSL